MKKLILSVLALVTYASTYAQIRPTFVYDDGTIRTGYFYSSAGFPGIYWSQGATPTPFAIDSTKRNTNVVVSLSMNSSNIASNIPNSICNVTSTAPGNSTTKSNVAAGAFKPFVLTFGNRNNDTTKPYTVDISANPVIRVTIDKPLTPSSNYYKRVGSGGSQGNYTTFATSTLSGNDVLYGIGGTSTATWTNDNPLFITVQVIDSAGARLELAVNNPLSNSTNFNSRKLGILLSTAAGAQTYTLDLSNAWVLNYNNPWFPGSPYICSPLLATGTTSAIANGAATCPLVLSSTPGFGFNYRKVAKILFFPSARCGGPNSTMTTLGFCAYGPANFNCYDNTFTITSFSIGSVPGQVVTPATIKIDSASFTSSSSIRLYYKDPSASFDSILIARSVVSTGGWSVTGKIGPGSSPSGLSTGNNAFDDGFLVTTTVGTTLTFAGGSFVTTGTYYYRIGVVSQGRITWSADYVASNGQRGTNVYLSEDYIPSASITLAPNPSTGITNLEYSLIRGAAISYKVYNSFGHEISSSGSNVLAPGTYNESINLTGKTPGIYLVTVFVDGKPAKTTKLMLE